MKNRVIHHVHEEARIYKRNYQPSFNLFRVFKVVLGIFISGESPAAHAYDYRKKMK